MADNIVDLVASPLALAARRSAGPPSAAAVGSSRRDPPHVIDLVNDDDDLDAGRLGTNGGAGRRRRNKRRRGVDADDGTRSPPFKTDPNERAHAASFVQGTTRSPASIASAFKQTPQPPGLSAAECAVLDVFPDVELAHLKSLLHQHSHQADLVIMHLIDCPTYPKETKAMAMAGSPLVKLEQQKWSFDFMTQGAIDAFQHPDYCAGTRALIHNLLPFLSVKALALLLEKHQYRYAICHDRVLVALKSGTTDEVEQFQQVDLAVNSGRLLRPDAQKQALAALTGLSVGQAFIRNTRKQVPLTLAHPLLVEEKEYVDSKWQDYRQSMLARIDRERHKQEADKAGIGLECACCFDTYAPEDMVACRDYGHLCCCGCLDQFASTKMWGEGNFGVDKSTKQPLLDLLCFNGGSEDCSSGFDRYSLVKALEAKNLKKYDELQCQLAVEQVCGDEMVSCPKCDYRAALPSGQKIFSCPVQGCRFESCRECGEAAHIPFRCDEVEKEAEAKGRLTVEEAITQARVRRCPNPRCKQPFVKSDGCNKVRCACGTIVCYVCRIAIKDYTHFCQTPHCAHESCAKCPLWTKAEEDDARAMREAGIEAAKVAASVAGVNINVEDILQAGVATTGQVSAAAPTG